MSKQKRRMEEEFDEIVEVEEEKKQKKVTRKAENEPVSVPKKASVKPASDVPLEFQINEIGKNLLELNKFTDKFYNKANKAFRDHETRITKIEETLGLAVEPKPEPELESEPAKVEPIAKIEPIAKAEPSVREDQPIPADNGQWNGPGKAFKFWDYKTRSYGFKTDIWAAKKAGNGEYEPVWVWYIDGRVDHILSSEEVIKYCP